MSTPRGLEDLLARRFASRLRARHANLWTPAAEREALVRLGWVDAHRSSRALLEEIATLRADALAAGLDHVVLCGMGGSSLAPEVICAAAGVELTVLDSSHPDQVRRAVTDRLARTLVVVSSKSGTTAETLAQLRVYEKAFADAGIDPASRFVVVTDPGSGLDRSARASGYRVVPADPDVGGRYSALTAFGLVPSGLAGADVARLLDEAETAAARLHADTPDNPALVLGASLAEAPLRDKVGLARDVPGLPGLADWVEQLVAESTGKDGTGLLPVVVETPAELAGTRVPDLRRVRLASGPVPHVEGDADSGDLLVSGPLGAQFLLWEVAVAAASSLLGVNPFDQPDVEAAKAASRGLLDRPVAAEPPAYADELVEVRGDVDGTAGTLEEILDEFLGRLDPTTGYVAVMAYLSRTDHPGAVTLREVLARRVRRPVTFGWGPRFLHSTGQYHKGSDIPGLFLQVTGEPAEDLAVADRPYTLGALIAAQAAGDARVLADRGRAVLRLHLRDPDRALPHLVSCLG